MNKRKYIRYVTPDKLEQVNENNKRNIQKYFSFKNMNLSDSSKKSYESDFNQWIVFIDEQFRKKAISNDDIVKLVSDEDGLEEMVDLLEDYMAFCTSILGNNERRIQRRMSSISSFFQFLIKKRRINTSPITYLERPSVRAGEKPQITQTFLTKEQVEVIRKGLKKKADLQLDCYFEVSLSTMARVNAVSNIKIEQIDFKNKRINDVLEKEGKIVSLFPSDRAFERIKSWLEYRKKNNIESEYLFLTKYNGSYQKVSKNNIQSYWVKKIGDIIDIPNLHHHDFRHSGSNLLYHSGMALEDVSLLLNHSSTDVTRNHYLQVNYDSIQGKKKELEI